MNGAGWAESPDGEGASLLRNFAANAVSITRTLDGPLGATLDGPMRDYLVGTRQTIRAMLARLVRPVPDPGLPEGWALEWDGSGWALRPPAGVALFDGPGEGAMLGAPTVAGALVEARAVLADWRAARAAL